MKMWKNTLDKHAVTKEKTSIEKKEKITVIDKW
jgi:hypothetical protein